MKKFKFHLESLEKVRKNRENLALKVFSEAKINLDSLIYKRNELFTELNLSLERRSELSSRTMSTSVLRVEDDFILGTKKRIEFIERKIKSAEKKLISKFGIYQEAKKKTKILEKLKEKRHLKHKKEIKIIEQKAQDDFYVMSAKKRKIG